MEMYYNINYNTPKGVSQIESNKKKVKGRKVEMTVLFKNGTSFSYDLIWGKLKDIEGFSQIEDQVVKKTKTTLATKSSYVKDNSSSMLTMETVDRGGGAKGFKGHLVEGYLKIFEYTEITTADGTRIYPPVISHEENPLNLEGNLPQEIIFSNKSF